MKNLSFTFVCFAAVILSSCSTETTYTVEVVDGVRTVHNLKPVYEGDSKISLEFVRQIGELDGDDENLQFFNPRAIDFDSEGNMYILDTGNYRIQKFDAEGNFLLSFGSKGQGPGEFESLTAMKILDDNTLLVSDRGNENLQSFTLTGELINTTPFKVDYYYIYILKNGTLLFNLEFYSRGTEEENTFLAGVFDQEMNVLKKFGIWEKFDNRMRNSLGNIVSFASNNDKIIYLTFAFRNKIIRFDTDGNANLEFNKQRSFEETEEPETKMMERDGRRIGLMEANVMYSTSILDSENRLWVMSTNKPFVSPPGEVDLTGVYNMDIYDREGILLQSIPWDIGYKRLPVFIKNDRMYFIDSAEMSIMEYRIVEH